MDNLPPCLKHNQGFPGIKFDKKYKGNSEDSLAHNRGYSQMAVIGLQCKTCLFWIDNYYMDIPILQSHIKTLTDLDDPLIDENCRLKSSIQKQGKRPKTTRNIILKNVESVTTMINSEIMLINLIFQLKVKICFCIKIVLHSCS
jgi:hypothetical protein